MTWPYLIVWASIVAFGLTAVYALVWAIGSGQLQNLSRGARSIFDEDEPIGRMTDGFPGSTASDSPGSTVRNPGVSGSPKAPAPPDRDGLREE